MYYSTYTIPIIDNSYVDVLKNSRRINKKITNLALEIKRALRTRAPCAGHAWLTSHTHTNSFARGSV